MTGLKGHRVEKAIILMGVCWHLTYPLSYRIWKNIAPVDCKNQA
jgi:hypothetical protein